MSEYRTGGVADALDSIDIENAFVNGGAVALLIDGEAVKATVVARVDESPYDNLDAVYAYDVWLVFNIGGQYFKRTGYWTSHEGRNWRGGKTTEVYPEERMVVVYE